MSLPLVSIVTPTYNHAKFIGDCILSVQAQTYTNWEMLIVNDGSTDDTFAIASKYAREDSRIRLFDQKNVGIFRLAETYNFALSQSKGKYISILEGDDVWTSEKLQRQVEVLESDENAVLAWGAAQSVSVDLSTVLGTHPVVTGQNKKLFMNDPAGSILKLLYYENCIPALTITVRKETLVSVGGFIQDFGLPLVDLPTLLELSLCGSFYFDEHVLGRWRIYPNQVTKTYPVEIINGRLAAAQAHNTRHRQVLEKQSGISFPHVKEYFHKIILIGYARSGRYKLIRRDFKAARRDYIKALFYRGPLSFSWRLRSLVGLLMSFLKTDVEWLARILGKKHYRS